MIEFGKKPKCCVCQDEADIGYEKAWYCFRHIPTKREKIGRYSGRSETPYGSYDQR